MKILLDAVVSSSVSLMHVKHVHSIESVYKRWPKNLAALRSLFISSRWTVTYYFIFSSWNFY